MSAEEPRLWNRQFGAMLAVNFAVNVGFAIVNTSISAYVVGDGGTLASAGFIVGTMPIAALLARPGAGFLADRLNRKWLLMAAVAVNALAIAGYAVSHDMLALTCLRILHGVAFSVTTTASMALVSDVMPGNRRGTGMGFFGAAQAAAMAAGPAAGLAIAARTGEGPMFCFAALMILISAAPLFLVKSAPAAPAGDRGHALLNNIVAREALPFGALALAIGTLTAVEVGFVALYASVLGIGNIGWYFTLSAAFVLAARTFSGRLLDRHGFNWILIPSLLFITAAMVILFLANPSWPVVALASAAVLKGVGTGMIQPALQAQAIASVDRRRRGAAASTYYIGMDAGQGGAPLVAGVLAAGVGYGLMYLLAAAPLLLISTGWLLVRRFGKKRNDTGTDGPGEDPAAALPVGAGNTST